MVWTDRIFVDIFTVFLAGRNNCNGSKNNTGFLSGCGDYN